MTRTKATTNALTAGGFLVGGVLVAFGAHLTSLGGGPCTFQEGMLGVFLMLAGGSTILITAAILYRLRHTDRP